MTALIYLAVLLFVAATVYVLAAVVFGRGEELGALPPGVTPTRLPDTDITGNDVRVLRFQQAVRGYRMAEVDWALGRLAEEIDVLRERVADLEARSAEPVRSEFATWFANSAAGVRGGSSAREETEPMPIAGSGATVVDRNHGGDVATEEVPAAVDQEGPREDRIIVDTHASLDDTTTTPVDTTTTPVADTVTGHTEATPSPESSPEDRPERTTEPGRDG